MVVNKDGFGALVSNPASSNRDVYQMVSEAPLDYQPGEYSRYRQSGYAIAEMVMEERLGESFDVLAARYVTGPAGMANTQHASARLDSEPAFLMSAGGFQTTADDMAKMFLNINNSVILTPGDWKAMLTDERYRFDDYSLGALIEERDGVLTVGHSGGGARANIRYAPDAKIGVMICTDERQNGGLAIQLARMLVHEIAFGEEPALPMMVALSGYRDMSAARVVAAYHSAAAEGDRYDLSGAEPLLNAIGYFYVAEERLDDAIEVFTLNSEAFPQSPNVHDSLGEALLMNGDREGALEQYRQVLTLAPDNENAAQMVARILEMND